MPEITVPDSKPKVERPTIFVTQGEQEETRWEALGRQFNSRQEAEKAVDAWMRERETAVAPPIIPVAGKPGPFAFQPPVAGTEPPPVPSPERKEPSTVTLKTGDTVAKEYFDSLTPLKQEKLRLLGVEGFNLSEAAGYQRAVTAKQKQDEANAPYIVSRDSEGRPQYDLSKMASDALASGKSEEEVTLLLRSRGFPESNAMQAAREAVSREKQIGQPSQQLFMAEFDGQTGFFNTEKEAEAWLEARFKAKQVEDQVNRAVDYIPSKYGAYREALKAEVERRPNVPVYLLATQLSDQFRRDGKADMIPPSSILGQIKSYKEAKSEWTPKRLAEQKAEIKAMPRQAFETAVAFVPIVGTAVLWNKMDAPQKALSIALDVLIVGVIARGIVKAGKAVSTADRTLAKGIRQDIGTGYKIEAMPKGYRQLADSQARFVKTVEKEQDLLVIQRRGPSTVMAEHEAKEEFDLAIRDQLAKAAVKKEKAALDLERKAEVFTSKAKGFDDLVGKQNIAELPKRITAYTEDVVKARYVTPTSAAEKLAKAEASLTKAQTRWPTEPAKWQDLQGDVLNARAELNASKVGGLERTAKELTDARDALKNERANVRADIKPKDPELERLMEARIGKLEDELRLGLKRMDLQYPEGWGGTRGVRIALPSGPVKEWSPSTMARAGFRPTLPKSIGGAKTGGAEATKAGTAEVVARPYQPLVLPLEAASIEEALKSWPTPSPSKVVSPGPAEKPSEKPADKPADKPGEEPEPKPGGPEPKPEPAKAPEVKPGETPEPKPGGPEVKPEPYKIPETKPVERPETKPGGPEVKPEPYKIPETKPVERPETKPGGPEVRPEPAKIPQTKALEAPQTDIGGGKAKPEPLTIPVPKALEKPEVKPGGGVKIPEPAKIPEAKGPSPKRPRPAFLLPSGEILKEGQYPRIVSWPQGKVKITLDLDTGARTYTPRETPRTVTPRKGFKVVATDTTEPEDQEFDMGTVRARVTKRTITFEPVKRPKLKTNIFKGRRRF